MGLVRYPTINLAYHLVLAAEIHTAYLCVEFTIYRVLVFLSERKSVVAPEGVRNLEIVVVLAALAVVVLLCELHIALGKRSVAVRSEILVERLFSAALRALGKHTERHIQRKRTEHTVQLIRAHRVKQPNRVQHVILRHLNRRHHILLVFACDHAAAALVLFVASSQRQQRQRSRKCCDNSLFHSVFPLIIRRKYRKYFNAAFPVRAFARIPLSPHSSPR